MPSGFARRTSCRLRRGPPRSNCSCRPRAARRGGPGFGGGFEQAGSPQRIAGQVQTPSIPRDGVSSGVQFLLTKTTQNGNGATLVATSSLWHNGSLRPEPFAFVGSKSNCAPTSAILRRNMRRRSLSANQAARRGVDCWSRLMSGWAALGICSVPPSTTCFASTVLP